MSTVFRNEDKQQTVFNNEYKQDNNITMKKELLEMIIDELDKATEVKNIPYDVDCYSYISGIEKAKEIIKSDYIVRKMPRNYRK